MNENQSSFEHFPCFLCVYASMFCGIAWSIQLWKKIKCI